MKILKQFLVFNIVFFIIGGVASSEDLFQSLISTYINNKELNSQREKAKAVNEELIQSYAILKPSITGTFSQSDDLNEGQKNQSGSSIADSNLQTKKKAIKVEQKILQGIPNILASKTNVKISSNELKFVEQNVLLKAVTAYTSVLASKKRLDITRDNLDLADKQVELDKSRYERGAIKLSDLAQSESSLADAKAKFIRSENSFAVSEKDYENIIGYLPKNLQTIKNLDLNLPKSLEETLELASLNNPELLISKLNFEKSNLSRILTEPYPPRAHQIAFILGLSSAF